MTSIQTSEVYLKRKISPSGEAPSVRRTGRPRKPKAPDSSQDRRIDGRIVFFLAGEVRGQWVLAIDIDDIEGFFRRLGVAVDGAVAGGLL